MQRRETYSYGPERNGVRLIITCAICILAFFATLLIIGRYINITPWIIYIHGVYWAIFVIAAVSSGTSILCKMQKRLKISDTEVHYLYGGLSKHKVSIPVSRVRSCKIDTSCLQRAFGTSTLSICTAGDKDEICFEDIKNGEEAYRTIMEMIQ